MNNFEFGEKMKKRTKSFAVQIVKFYKKLPKTDEARVLGRQALACSTTAIAGPPAWASGSRRSASRKSSFAAWRPITA
jgi:hypothetical protein